jgi:hypothetical protein
MERIRLKKQWFILLVGGDEVGTEKGKSKEYGFRTC